MAGHGSSLACAPYHSARASTCGRLALAATRWSSNSYTISYARLRTSAPYCVSLPFRLQSRSAGFDSPMFRKIPLQGHLSASLAAGHPSYPCYLLTKGMSPIDTSVLELDHAWEARVNEGLPLWVGLPGCGVALHVSRPRLTADTAVSNISRSGRRSSPDELAPILGPIALATTRLSCRTTTLSQWMNSGFKGTGWIAGTGVTKSGTPSGWEERTKRIYICTQKKDVRKEVATQGLSHSHTW